MNGRQIEMLKDRKDDGQNQKKKAEIMLERNGIKGIKSEKWVRRFSISKIRLRTSKKDKSRFGLGIVSTEISRSLRVRESNFFFVRLTFDRQLLFLVTVTNIIQ